MNTPRSAISESGRSRAISNPLNAFVLVLAIFCGSAWLSGSIAAQTISVDVCVTNEKSQPLPQAKVELRLKDQLLASAATDNTGNTKLSLPNAGSYLLIVSKKSYLSNQSELRIAVGSDSERVDVVLSTVLLSQQNITVEGTVSSPVAETSSSESTLTPSQVKETPSRPATLTDTLPLIPGIVRGPDGSVRIAGYGENHSTMLVNSVDVTDPATGDFGLSVPIDSVQSIAVAEMPYLAQYGRFTAGVVSAETRRGGDKWKFNLNDPLPDFRIRSAHLSGLKDASPRLDLSGPLVAGRVYFSEGAEYLLNKQEVRTLPFPVNQTTSTAINSFTQIDAIISPAQTLTASLHLAPHSLAYAGLDYFNPQPVVPNESFHESTGTVLDRLALGGGVLQSTLAITRISSAVEPQGTANMVLSPLGNQGNFFMQEARQATRFEWIENWTPRKLQFAGSHTLQVGSVLSHSESDGQLQARPVLIEDAAARLMQRIDFAGTGAFAVSDLAPAVYVQDHWALNSRFALDTGIRFEGQTITHTSRTAPRTGFVWTPTKDGKLVVRGGVGIFFDYVPLDVYAFNGYPAQLITSYNSLGVPLGAPVPYLNLTQQAAQQGFPLVERGRTAGNFAPYSVAWNVEAQRSFTRLLQIQIKYLQSQAQDMLTIQPQVIQGQNAFVLGSLGTARTRQYEFAARIGTASQRQFFFSYVRQQARGNINDANAYLDDLPFPTIRQNLFASLPSEIPNRFLLWGIYHLPHKVRVIPRLEYRSGFPYQPLNVLQQFIALNSGPQPRFPRYFSFDLRISKDIKIGSKHAVRLSPSIMNLTNHFNPLEVHSNLAGPQYGTFFGNYPRRFMLDFDFLY